MATGASQFAAEMPPKGAIHFPIPVATAVSAPSTDPRPAMPCAVDSVTVR
jgi:hypothetical protein